MPLPRPRLVVLFLLLATLLRAGSLESAFQVRAMLGPGVWSRVLRMENDRAGRGSRYPAEFHGLLVAFEDRLWLYTEFDGTQSLSLQAGRLEQDRADPGPLLRAVDPGLTRFADVTDRPPASLPDGLPPRHCFPASVRRWQQLHAEANPPERARLLAYYPWAKPGGHMVLEYWREGRRFLFDPDDPGRDRELPARLDEDPLRVAQALFRPDDRKRPMRAMHLDLSGA